MSRVGVECPSLCPLMSLVLKSDIVFGVWCLEFKSRGRIFVELFFVRRRSRRKMPEQSSSLESRRPQMSLEHVVHCTSKPLPEIDTVNGPPDGSPDWPHCVPVCSRNRNDRVCPLLTQYQCHRCKRVLAYLVHGMRSGIKRRVYGETRILHLWPSFSDTESIFCTECARARYPNVERVMGKSFEQAWKDIRNYDHVTDTDI